MINESVLNFILKWVFSVFRFFINLLTVPVDRVLIKSGLPVSTLLNSIKDFLSLCLNSIGWVIDALGIPHEAIVLIVLYYSIVLTINAGILFITILLSWLKGTLRKG